MAVLEPGDVFEYAFGIDKEIVEALLLEVEHTYPDGAMQIRWRYASNPRGVDWRGFIPAGEAGRVLRHEEHADLGLRTLLP